MRSALAHAAQRRAERRQRSNSLSTVPPPEGSDEYDPELAAIAASILYRNPLPSQNGRRVYILNAAAFPDATDVDYDVLLSYVLARLPGEDELLSGTEYEIIFFAGGQPEGATTEKRQGPGMGWYLQTYHLLSRATRKKLQILYIVHPRTWVRVLLGVFGTIVSPKFRRKTIHVNTLSALALHVPMEKLLIPPAVYLHDRKLSPDIYVPFATGSRAFGVKYPLPKNINTGETRLPRVLRETTSFILNPANIKTEGIFRIPPHSTLSGVLKEAYDRGQHFIIWKDKGVTVVQPGIEQATLDEVRLEDAYSVHLAASLVKQWYRDLREPIFPESSYAALNDKYIRPDTPVTPEDLVEFILPQSALSPLSQTARHIMRRHLLPLLSEVAAHESQNKMNAENLAVCFSMCLVCGSNQIEDVKMSSIVKRVLKAAIEMWPQLRDGMGMSPSGLFADIQNPADPNDYEDPLEEQKPPRQALPPRDGEDSPEGHRIVLEDLEDKPAPGKSPPRPSRSEFESIPKRAPTLPPRPAVASNLLPTPPASEPTFAIPRRKPAPPIIDPPRYSTVFDSNGESFDVADSPTSYVQVDGFGPPRRSPWSFDEVEKKGFPPSTFPEPTTQYAAPNLPKRGLSTEHDNEQAPASTGGSGSALDPSLLARMAAQRGAAISNQQQSTSTPTDLVDSPESIPPETDPVFRKPSWPASAPPQSLSKPVLPQRQPYTLPFVSAQTNGNNQTAPAIPKLRAPTPDLLKRINSIGSSNSTPTETPSISQPKKLDLKKASVEDLRRLYEDRVSTAKCLASADKARKGSMSST